MTRIVAGTHGGRRLAVPEGRDTRPTSDRVREALFGALESRYGLAGSRFADLYAGSGAIGLEAHSRGAERVLLVESGAKAARVIRENIVALRAGQSVELLVSTAQQAVKMPPGQPYDIVFADPPYAVTEAEISALLSGLAGNGWLAEDAIVVIERGRRSPEPQWPEGLYGDKPKKYGETTLWYARHEPQAEPS
ncbi:16S rRNA (guanine(966)-N(2))-methyltransferase RsmD [Longispora albida]|uniref:16S rRNA (guanine(966)-N(2))-methyltransferase RsmD n=1 Tax=Longispora albida TaxID=203523 RepID=UPI00036FF228|nr:16S rRNA (guanine(966)-N(2))-methyltransferase RsmD [Longispora albida]